MIWVGIIPANSTPETSTMIYSIDGGPGSTAVIAGSPSTASPDIFNQYLFQTAPVPAGEHVLEVVYNGNAPQNAPLVLDDFIVLNRTSDTASTTAAPSETASTSTTTTGLNPSDAKSPDITQAAGAPPRSNFGEKVGLAVGGCLALIALMVLIYIICRRRGRLYHKSWDNWTIRSYRLEDGRD